VSYLVSELVEDTRDALLGTYRARWNALGAAISTTTQPTVTLADSVRAVGVGSILAIGDELLYVRSIAGSVATVLRGFRGTTAATYANGTVLEENPRFPKGRIKQALRDEVRSWPASLFRVEASIVPVTSNQRLVSLPFSDVLRVLEARRDPSSSLSWAIVSSNSARDTYPAVEARLVRAGPAAVGGWSVELDANVPAGSIYVLLARPFDTSVWDDSTDLEDDVGLASFMFDIPRWGAMGRLLSEEESLRVAMTAQPQPRRAQEVANAEILQSGQFFQRRRDVRVREAASMLREMYPLSGWS
jgi:hypothetical protein